MFKKVQKKRKITDFKNKEPYQYYWSKLVKNGYKNLACSVADNLVIRLAVKYDRFTGRANVRLVKYRINDCEFILVYDYNVAYKSEKELKDRFYSKWIKTVDAHNV